MANLRFAAVDSVKPVFSCYQHLLWSAVVPNIDIFSFYLCTIGQESGVPVSGEISTYGS